MDQKNVDSDDNVDSEVDIADSYTEIEGNDQTKEFQGIDVKRSDRSCNEQQNYSEFGKGYLPNYLDLKL
ncbi:hypothetical protein KUTeg_011503 [Tegillarca granosa]|uniref:Uncharacterized protein n=1 Tax=Tegillarca granosa TaxID=220873 RepID=A0ABQ9F0L4_TEGGR|nr:hypothetical protein KUTeg_011503 [Tegillarca granosa]